MALLTIATRMNFVWGLGIGLNQVQYFYQADLPVIYSCQKVYPTKLH